MPTGFLINNGRGDSKIPISNVIELVFDRMLGDGIIRFDWNDIYRRKADWDFAPPPQEVKYNGMAFQLRKMGYRTLGELSEATGVPMQTLRNWEGVQLPVFDRKGGLRIISADDFDKLVEHCKTLHVPKRPLWAS